ncbi:4-hydroxy-tetrahydrodipicolinate synthase [Robiginitalea sp. M366]|uniref:4-hydroxy-tetrahydrodipicolinate synthase n=1 Tax=Robiginitalea aestuariiviva TaxID=3036903 RepID=UPI00240D65D5|nr:4-hydroxy-tetrahydrodipicolinate synthase [Robiginitalea aestuariiviva]MDG1573137.1 4-hydroxy-tetrahydrodipicolinate synthase [Robiginitalea aestuariiviva]
MKTLFEGTGVALVTPFREDLSLDLDALRHLVDDVIEGGVDYLVALGTTAESATLSRAEKQQVMQTVLEANAGRKPLVVGIGGNHTLAVGEELQQTPLQGFDAVLSVSPYYNRPTQEGIYRHFRYLAERSPLPLILYNVPARTGSNMLAGTTLRLARECPNLIGIKEACGDMAQIRDLAAQLPEDFLLLSGDDFTAVDTVLAGGAGVISVLGQGLPRVFSGMMRQAAAGNREAAQQQSQALTPLMQGIFREGNPAGIKALLHLKGICTPAVRLPLVAASAGLTEHLARELKTLEAGQPVGR